MFDIDCDYQSDRRDDVKRYIEERYNIDSKARVFSAGTFTTLKIKAALKDVSRIHSVPVAIVNYITAIISDDGMSFSDFIKLAYSNKKIKSFVMDYSVVIEEIRTLMNQPRSTSVHASAVIPIPSVINGEHVECFDILPMRKMDGLIVSEIDGYDCDSLGLCKLDVLSTRELTKMSMIFKLVKKHYNEDLSLEYIEQNCLGDENVYQMFTEGYTQDVFQFSSKGITKLTKDMQPDCMEDLSAINALYRPATIAMGSPDAYVRFKHKESEPVYLWGTYETMKDTYGLLVYQEQLAKLSNKIGLMSIAEGVQLVKYISKKKVDKIEAYQEKFMAGALSQGCPEEDAKVIWDMFIAGGSYLFNCSHSMSYALLSFVGMYLKTHFPTAFYTISLQFAKDDDIKILMGEMAEASICKIVPPDINNSGVEFTTDYEKDLIFWSITRIKFVGLPATQLIVKERDENGPYLSFQDFNDRLSKRTERAKMEANADGVKYTNPIDSRTKKNMIFSGCFDIVEGVNDVVDRVKIMEQHLGEPLPEKDFPPEMIFKSHWWSMKQIELSSLGSVDYQRILSNSGLKNVIKGVSFMPLSEAKDLSNEEKKVLIVATLAEIEEKSYKDKQTGMPKLFAKILLQQNNDSIELILWDDKWDEVKDEVFGKVGKIIVVSCRIKYSQFSNMNGLQCDKHSIIKILD